MIRRDIKSVTVEYQDGSVETFQEDNMYQVSKRKYKSGATHTEIGYIDHGIRWIDPFNILLLAILVVLLIAFS